MYLFKYSGPVYRFKRMLTNNWEAYTYAASEPKARANLSYQYKKQKGLVVNAHISLLGKLEMVPVEESNDQISIADWLKSENRAVLGLR